MKLIILSVLAFMFIGFMFEWIFRIVCDGSLSLLEKMNKLKLLLMMPVYGIACVMIGLVYKIPFMQNITFLPLMMFVGMVIADCCEFGFGYLYNIKLKLNIWDYSDRKIVIFGKTIPLNFMGQIDLFHTILWAVLTIAVIYFQSIIGWLGK